MVKDGIVLGKRYEVLSKIGAGGMADVYKGKRHNAEPLCRDQSIEKRNIAKTRILSVNSIQKRRQPQDF